jgi:hypothetical protein
LCFDVGQYGRGLKHELICNKCLTIVVSLGDAPINEFNVFFTSLFIGNQPCSKVYFHACSGTSNWDYFQLVFCFTRIDNVYWHQNNNFFFMDSVSRDDDIDDRIYVLMTFSGRLMNEFVKRAMTHHVIVVLLASMVIAFCQIVILQSFKLTI